MKINQSDIRPDVPLPMPPGLTMAWPKTRATIPSGWALCDGLWYDPLDMTVGQVGQAETDATHTVQTPNMIDRMIAGAGNFYAVGATAGAATHTLTLGELPAHAHAGPSHTHGLAAASAASAGEHWHLLSYPTVIKYSPDPDHLYNDSLTAYDPGLGYDADLGVATGCPTDNAGEHTHNLAGDTNADGTGNTANAGSGTAMAMLPPYYAAYWIQKL